MSEKKVLETLEKNPAGLSITDVAQKSKLHRNTVSRVINKLKKEGKVEMKKAGSSKLYYSKEYSALHKTESGYKGKNISVGIGVSDLQDGYQAAISATKQAVHQATKGTKPTFSLVFVSSKYNPQIDKVVKGINKILGTKNWIGCTTDKEINSILGYCEGTVEVLCIDTKHLYFGVGVSENYRKDPVEEGKKATLEAIEDCPADRSKFATAQFMRGTKKKFADIIKNPPYFVLTFPGGMYFENKRPIPGMESEFLEGIKKIVGSFVPIIGVSTSSNTEKIFKNEGENYTFVNGKYYKKGAIVCFVISELQFSYELSCNYIPTNKYGITTKVSENGRIIEEINGKPAVDEYCRLIEVRKEEFLKNPLQYIIKNPICLVDKLRNIYPQFIIPKMNESRGLIVSDMQNMFFVIGEKNKEKNIIKNIITKAYQGYEKENLVLSLNFNSGIYSKKEVEEDLSKIQEILVQKNSLLFGCCTLGVIGTKKTDSPSYNNLSSSCLLLFDKLQTE